MQIVADGDTLEIHQVELGNSQWRKDLIHLHRMADGSITTYVKLRGRVKQYTFKFNRATALLFKAFAQEHLSSIWTFEDGTVGHLMTNPIEIAMYENDEASITIDIDENST